MKYSRGKHVFCKAWLYPAVASIVSILIAGVLLLLGYTSFAAKILFWGLLISAIGLCLPGSFLNSISMEAKSIAKKVLTIAIASALILISTYSMSLSPVWNGSGEEPFYRGHLHQYELLTESFLNGHVYIDYQQDDAELAALDNPYDPDLRIQSGATFHWDHAYFNRHYYVYFGVVPVLLVFLPYRLITGQVLMTYHATQIFVAGIILGIFALFHLLSKLFFKKMTYGMFLFLSIAFSAMSVWYSVEAPALYCTAITAAIFLETLSLYFFIKAVWSEKTENKQLLNAFFGAVLGALSFGCRPTIALANLLVIPMLVVFLKQRKISPKLIGKLFLTALPYAIVAAGLMSYNYVRFQNPFEFGQTYQLTLADQTGYASFLQSLSFEKQFLGMKECFVAFHKWTETFPYITFGGALVNFPILLLGCGVFSGSVRRQMKQKKLFWLVLGLFLTSVIIAFFDVLMSPWWTERYHLDIYFLLGIVCFIVIGFTYNSIPDDKKRRYAGFVMAFSLLTTFTALMLFLVPNDCNITNLSPGFLDRAQKVILFWY